MNETVKSIRDRYYSGNVGGAWFQAERIFGAMTYQEFMSRFIWGESN